MTDIEKELVEALERALRYHGVMFLSDPPQDAWKAMSVEPVARAAIARAKQQAEPVDRIAAMQLREKQQDDDSQHGRMNDKPFDISGRTPAMHAAVRSVLKHHKLTLHGDGVVEADLIEALLKLMPKPALAQQAEPVADDGVRRAAAMVISAWDWANLTGQTAPNSLRGWIEILRERLVKPVQAEPGLDAVQAEPVDVKALAAKAGLPLAWISETGVIQWSQLERLIALAQQAEPVAAHRQATSGDNGQSMTQADSGNPSF